MHLLKEIPFIRFLFFLIPGIVLSYLLDGAYQIVFLSVTILSGFGFILFHFSIRFYRDFRKRWMTGVFAFAFLFSLGWVVTDIRMPTRLEHDFLLTAKGKIVSVEKGKGVWTRIIFDPYLIKNDSLPFKKGDLWLLMVRGDLADKILQPGILIAVKGTLLKHKGPSNPHAFNYGAYLFRNGISGQMYLNSNMAQVVNSEPERNLQVFANSFRSQCTNVFSANGVSGSRLALLNALVLGERKGIDRELNEKFIRSGAIHLLAVSGLHVGIVFLFLNYILSFFLKPAHPLRVIIIVLILFFYAFITGFSPSVTRAVVMFSFIQTGKAFLRHINMYNILCLSAFIILLWNPMFLFHAGFWLSHLAVAGIVAFYPVINNCFSFKFILWRWLWSVISVSISAQITTFPISLWLFGSFPSYFLMANILLLPIVAPVLIISFIILMISWLPVIPLVLGAFLNDLVGFMEGTVHFIESMPGSYLTNVWVSWPLAVVLYLLIYYIYQNYEDRNSRLILKTTFLVTVVVLIVNIQWIIKSNTNKFVVFDTGNEFLAYVVSKGKGLTFSSKGLEDFKLIYAAGAFEKRNIIANSENYFFNTISGNQLPEVYRIKCGNKIYCMINGGMGSLSKDERHKADVLIIAGSPNLEIISLVESLQCKTIVFASNCSPWRVNNWQNQLAGKDLFMHDVKNMGAFIDYN